MSIITMLVILVLALVLGIPAVFSMGLASLSYFFIERGIFDIPDYLIAQRTVFGLDSFTMLAIPLFLLVGKVMNESNVTTRLFDFAKALVGHFRGGLGQVNILASVIFSGMRSEEHTSELQSRGHLVCRLLLEKKKKQSTMLSFW